jgi:hypothetical protein
MIISQININLHFAGLAINYVAYHNFLQGLK